MQSAAALCVMHTTRMTKMVTPSAQKLIKRKFEKEKKNNSAKSEVTLHMVLSNSFIHSSNKTDSVLDVGFQNFFTFGKKNVSEAL